MSEDWRRKKYYGPRVLIDTERILDPQFDDILICLTGAQVEMLRNMTQYLHRRSTFAQDYDKMGYLAPDNEDWDIIQAIVANLEEALMGCDGIVAQLAAIARAIKGVTGPSSTTPAMVENYVTSTGMQYTDDYGTETVPVDEDRCATAQLAWSFGYEMITEIFQPIQDKLSDVMIPVAMVAIATWVGTPALGIPVGILLATVWGAIEAWEEGQLANVVNGYLSAKEELVCAVYLGLSVDAQTAYSLAAEVIEDLPAWSPIDIALGKLLYSPWVISRMALAWDNLTTWAVNNVESGYCDICTEVIQGTDWYAKPVSAIDGTIYVTHEENPGWDDYCFDFTVLADETYCGVIFEVKDAVGLCILKRMSAVSASCTDRTRTWPDTSPALAEYNYFSVNGTNIDEVECKAALAPGGEDLVDNELIEGLDDAACAWHYGWNCTGTVTIVVKFLVFEGSPPA